MTSWSVDILIYCWMIFLFSNNWLNWLIDILNLMRMMVIYFLIVLIIIPACADRNAERVSCANQCAGGTCSQPIFINCPTPCQVNGCECRPGWLKLSANNPVCVPREFCTRLREEGDANDSVADDVEWNKSITFKNSSCFECSL